MNKPIFAQRFFAQRLSGNIGHSTIKKNTIHKFIDRTNDIFWNFFGILYNF